MKMYVKYSVVLYIRKLMDYSSDCLLDELIRQ